MYGAINILELALRQGAKIFQASTSEVYGDPLVHPQRENYWGHVNPVGPRSCYDEGKRCAETLFFDYYRQHRVRINVGRIFNTYGPYMQVGDGRVVSNFIVQALEGSPITLYGDGTQTRSFCYVSDMVEAMQRFMETADSAIGPLNLGNPAECSMAGLAWTVKRLTRSRSPILFRPLPADDPRRRQPDIRAARELLDWSPKVELHQGLAQTIKYFSTVLREAAPRNAASS